MKYCNRILAVLLVAALLAAAVPAVFAAGSSKNATAGSSVTLSFSYSSIYGLDGEFSLNDPSGIVESWKVSGSSGSLVGTASTKAFFYSATGTSGNVTINVLVQLKSSAQPGQTASIVFNYEPVVDAMGTPGGSKTDTSTVTVIQQVTPVEPTPTVPVATTPTDYSELERQIAIANGLNELEYSAESWDAMIDALTAANKALETKDQDTVDKAAADLQTAIGALVKMDYSKLEEVLKKAEEFVTGQEMGDQWLQFAQAVNQGYGLLTSGDQTAVDEITQTILDLLAKMEQMAAQESTPEIVYKEVEVEVPPTDDFCNIPMHRVWPVLFFISLAVNVVLGGAIILVMTVRKKKHDDTPLVDYNIDDDMDM